MSAPRAAGRPACVSRRQPRARIELTHGTCWTLFVTGPRIGRGFPLPGGWVHWRDFTNPGDGGEDGWARLRGETRMAEHSTIEWTHHTWSPWIGCQKVSPACDGCYAST